MQEYKEIALADIARDAVMQLQNNIKTIASRYSGTTFPTGDLYDGMQCYRTDTKKSYVYNGTTETWDIDSQGNDDLFFTGVHTSSVTEIKCYPYGAQGWDVSFPNVTKIASGALAERAVDGTNTLHFDYHKKKAIQALDGYPLFGSQEGQFNILFDLNKNGIEMSIVNTANADVWVGGNKMTDDTVLIQPSQDTSVIVSDGKHFLFDTVNETEDFEYTATAPTTGTSVGYSTSGCSGKEVTTTFEYNGALLATITGYSPRIIVNPLVTIHATATVIDDGITYVKKRDLTSIEKAYFSSFEMIDGDNYFVSTDGETTYVGISVVENVSNNYFQNRDDIVRVDFPNCLKVGTFSFNNCEKLKSLNLLNCTEISESAFSGCYSLTEITLPACQTISNKAFSECTNLEKVYLPSCKMLYKATFEKCLSIEEIHFAAANQAAIEALTAYSSKFGATNATIYFDL